MRGSRVDQALLLFAFIQLGLEYQSIYLFSWPLNHSCAKPPLHSDGQQAPTTSNHHHHHQQQQQQPSNLQLSATKDYAFNDSRRNLVNPDAIQTNLFDAYPDDLFTLARAYSMGVKYDDIAGCLQYKRQFDNATNTSSVDLSQLETCPYGLHFEEPTRTVSAVSFFNLACSRQYLTILMPNSFAFGLLAGITITAYCLIKKVDSNSNNAADQSSRQQAASGGANTQAATGPRYPPVNLYYWLLAQIAASLMLQINSYLVGCYISTEDDSDSGEGGDPPSQHPELYGQFVGCILLRSYVAASNLTRIIYMHNKTTVKKNKELVCHELFRDNHRRFLLFGATFILFEALYAPVALRLVSRWWQLNELLTVYSFCFTFAVFIRELIASGSGGGETGHGANGERGATNQLVLETNIDEPVGWENNPVERTVYSRCEFCSITESPISTADNPYAPTTTQPVTIDGVLSSHNSSLTQQALQSRYLMVQLVLLTFCLSFNYFLFLMLPDHKLLHSETTASRFRRKLSYAEAMTREKRPAELYQYTIEPVAGPNVTVPIFYDNETFVGHATNRPKQFDFRSSNGATQSIESMKNSLNPIEILWNTAKLNEWPLDLFVFALHLSRISKFETVYFKLGRLFTAIQLGAKFLAFQWLLVGFVKRQNHLLEWDWLYTLCVLLARLSSGLMLFNYVNSMLKLNTRLATNRLMLFLPNTLIGLLAFSLASYAPLFEWLDLVIIPISAISTNLLALWLTKDLGEQFKVSLCPMIFEDPEQSNRQQQQRMVLVEPVAASDPG